MSAESKKELTDIQTDYRAGAKLARKQTEKGVVTKDIELSKKLHKVADACDDVANHIENRMSEKGQ